MYINVDDGYKKEYVGYDSLGYWDALCHSDQQSLPSSLPVRQRVGLPSHWMHCQTLSLLRGGLRC